MPNPSIAVRGSRGTCQQCDAYGGPERFEAVHCLRPNDSGKAVSKMPEVGCSAWRPAIQQAGKLLDNAPVSPASRAAP